mgnify:CR=1 FL=1|tara:strand:- start:513 stop:995 length:483 start_codon:yes stop_codon:yes gene_type:complete
MSFSQNVNERRIHDEALKETIIESLRDEIAREITNESILEEEDEAIDERFGDEALNEILNEWDEDEQVKIEINDFFHPPIIEVVDKECDESCPGGNNSVNDNNNNINNNVPSKHNNISSNMQIKKKNQLLFNYLKIFYFFENMYHGMYLVTEINAVSIVL